MRKIINLRSKVDIATTITDPDLLALARRAVAVLQARENEDVDKWAEELVESLFENVCQT